MEYSYKTVPVCSDIENSLSRLNKLYEDGWEFFNSVSEFASKASEGKGTSYGTVYFTVRKSRQPNDAQG